jgi:hypothetical protein
MVGMRRRRSQRAGKGGVESSNQRHRWLKTANQRLVKKGSPAAAATE